MVRQPDVILSIDPRYALGFLAHRGIHSFVVLGGVFLAITGAEALYAHMRHLGRNLPPGTLLCFPHLLSYTLQTALFI